MAGDRAALVVPGGLDRVTGGNVYDRVIVGALEARGWRVDVVPSPRSVPRADVVILDSLGFEAGPPPTETPVVALAHQLPWAAEGRSPSPAERRALGAARLVVTVSETVRRAIAEMTPGRTVVVPPGRDRAWAAEGVPGQGRDVLVVANAVPGKGVPDAVRAFAAAELPDAGLVLAGDLRRDPREARRLSAARHGVDRVEEAGVLAPDELAVRYRSARLLITGSAYEGWPIAVAEAMASGIPVTGYAAPGVAELVRDGVDGVLVPPGDVTGLAAELRRLWSDPGLVTRMGTAARRRALGWPTWAETGERFADALEELRPRAPAGPQASDPS